MPSRTHGRRRRRSAAKVLQRVFRRKLRGRRRAIRDYRLHKRVFGGNIIPISHVTESTMPKVTWNFLNGEDAFPADDISFNCVMFGYYLGKEQKQRFPGLLPLGGLRPPSAGPFIPDGNDTTTSTSNPIYDMGDAASDDEMLDGGLESTSGGMTPAIKKQKLGFAPTSVTDGAGTARSMVQAIGGGRYYRLGTSKISVKIEMNPPGLPQVSYNAGQLVSAKQARQHINMPYEFRMITFKPKRHTRYFVGDDPSQTGFASATDNAGQFSSLTNYWPFADYRTSLFLGSDGKYFGPENAKETLLERARKHGMKIMQTGFNGLVTATSLLSDSLANVITSVSPTSTVADDQQSVLSKQALMAMFEAPVNRQHFSVIEDKKFTLSPPAVSVGVTNFSEGDRASDYSNHVVYSGHDPKLPQVKNIRHVVPHNKKVDSYHPNAEMAGYATIYFVRQRALDGRPDNFDVTIRGYTTYTDNFEN